MAKTLSQSLYKPIKEKDEPLKDEIITAISKGQYSWACVLILKYWGEDPGLFIPPRTYHRLLSDRGYVKRNHNN